MIFIVKEEMKKLKQHPKKKMVVILTESQVKNLINNMTEPLKP
jgi:hypothetical protein